MYVYMNNDGNTTAVKEWHFIHYSQKTVRTLWVTITSGKFLLVQTPSTHNGLAGRQDKATYIKGIFCETRKKPLTN